MPTPAGTREFGRRMRGGRAEEDGRQPRPRSGASWRFLEFGLPPLVFLAVVFRIVTHPASPAALVTFVTAAAAALAAEAFTFPMDALKAGVQVRGSRTGDTGGGASMSWFQYVGLLYYGLRAALMRTIPYTGMRMTMYMVFKNMGGGLSDSPVILAAMAALAGVICQLLLSPIDLFKVRMQADAASVRSRPFSSSSSTPSPTTVDPPPPPQMFLSAA